MSIGNWMIRVELPVALTMTPVRGFDCRGKKYVPIRRSQGSSHDAGIASIERGNEPGLGLEIPAKPAKPFADPSSKNDEIRRKRFLQQTQTPIQPLRPVFPTETFPSSRPIRGPSRLTGLPTPPGPQALTISFPVPAWSFHSPMPFRQFPRPHRVHSVH